MMDFGGDFDDDIFTEARQRSLMITPISYDAKICTAGWFHDVETEESSQKQNLLKFRADDYYGQKQYHEALECYTKCQAVIPNSNTTVLREVQEARSRCNLHLGDEVKAVELAWNVYESGQNFEQRTTALMLLGDVFQTFHRRDEELTSVQSLLILHPINPELWIRLGRLYTKLHEIKSKGAGRSAGPRLSASAASPDDKNLVSDEGTTGVSMRLTVSEVNACDGTNQHSTSDPVTAAPSAGDISLREKVETTDFHGDILLRQPEDAEEGAKSTSSSSISHTIAACACLSRARVLFQNVQRTVTSFAKCRNRHQIDKLKDEILSYGFSSEMLDTFKKCMGADLRREDEDSPTDPDEDVAKTDNDKLEKLAAYTRHQFEEKWFAWARSYPTCDHT